MRTIFSPGTAVPGHCFSSHARRHAPNALFWALSVLLFIRPVSAATPPELEKLQAEALANNPELKAAGLQQQAAGEAVKQASVLPDPMIGVNYNNDGYGPTLGQRDMSVLNFTYSQTLPWFGKRALRGEAAHHAASHSAANLKRVALDLRAGVARAYWNLLADEALLKLTESLRQNGALIEAAARTRYATGLGPQTDVLRAQAELSRLGERSNELEAEREGMRADLNALLGRPPGDPLTLDGELPEIVAPPATSELLATIEDSSPDIEALKAAISADEAEVKLARIGSKPDLSLMGGVGYRGRLDPMWMVGVSINLPRRSRVGAEVSGASYRRQADEAHLEALRRELEARTRARLAKLSGLIKTIRLYAEGILPQDRLALQSALNDYSAGRIPFAAALESAAMLGESQGAWVRSRRDALLTLIDAEALNPERDTPMDGGAPHHPTGMR